MTRLTVRQNQIASLVARGLSNKHIARELSITEGTVKNHLHAINDRLKITSRVALMLQWMQEGNEL